MRLTKKMTDEYGYWYESDKHLTDKLGQLEDIEEELGIDLITLFKALKQETLFVKTNIGIKETIKHGDGWGVKFFELEDDRFIIVADILFPNTITHRECLTTVRLKLDDYGKTWALTRESCYDKRD